MLRELRRGRAIGRRVTLSYQLETEIIRDAIFFQFLPFSVFSLLVSF